MAPALAFCSRGWGLGFQGHQSDRSECPQGRSRVVCFGMPEPSGTSWVAPFLGGCSGQGAAKWDEWLQMHEHAFIRRMIGSQSAAHYASESGLVQHIGPQVCMWRRNRAARLLLRWEASMVAAWGAIKMRRVQRPVYELWVALGAVPRVTLPHPCSEPWNPTLLPHPDRSPGRGTGFASFHRPSV